MKKIRRLIWISAIGILVLAFLFLLFMSRTRDGEPEVDRSVIWIDIVSRGDVSRYAYGTGNLVGTPKSADLIASLQFDATLTGEVTLNQKVEIVIQSESVPGHVIRIAKPGENCSRVIDVAFDGPLPTGVSQGGAVSGTINMETLRDVVYMGFPPHAQPNTVRFFFKLDKDGKWATRVQVKLGRASVNAIEVLDGLKVGDRVILSDMSNFDNVERVEVKKWPHSEIPER